MNIASLWDQLVDAVCRPPRDTYEESDLVGGIRATFSFGESRRRIRKYYRQDIEIINGHGKRLQCSHYRPCVVTSKDGRLPCVVYCHTNSGSRRDAEEILYTLLPKGITVFAFDFSGSGLSDGQWVTLGAREVDDLHAVVEYIRAEGSTSTLGLWGRSMGAVTALLYSCRDPTIAGVVADSPFSRLVDLMLELATDPRQGITVPRPLIKVALSMMRRAVRRRAGFNIDDVSPVDSVPASYVPTLFGHGADDTFVPPHHGERLFVVHGAETKNYIAFEGEHNGLRPDFWYDSALIFLLGTLRVEELVGPEIDLHSVPPESAPHMTGHGIYVTRATSASPSPSRELFHRSRSFSEGGEETSGAETRDEVLGEGADNEGEGVASFMMQSETVNRQQRGVPAPWERFSRETTAHARLCSTQDEDEDGIGKDDRDPGGEQLPFPSTEDEEEAMLQQVLALSLSDRHHGGGGGGGGGAVGLEFCGGGVITKENEAEATADDGDAPDGDDCIGRDQARDLDDVAQLAQALAESTRRQSCSHSDSQRTTALVDHPNIQSASAAVDDDGDEGSVWENTVCSFGKGSGGGGGGSKAGVTPSTTAEHHRPVVEEHASQEAAAAHAAAVDVQRAMADMARDPKFASRCPQDEWTMSGSQDEWTIG